MEVDTDAFSKAEQYIYDSTKFYVTTFGSYKPFYDKVEELSELKPCLLVGVSALAWMQLGYVSCWWGDDRYNDEENYRCDRLGIVKVGKFWWYDVCVCDAIHPTLIIEMHTGLSALVDTQFFHNGKSTPTKTEPEINSAWQVIKAYWEFWRFKSAKLPTPEEMCDEDAITMNMLASCFTNEK